MRSDADFVAAPNGCTVPAPEALAYAWALVQAAGASEILLAGFDGYDGQSNTFRQTDALIATLMKNSTVPARSVTASHYAVPHLALYAE